MFCGDFFYCFFLFECVWLFGYLFVVEFIFEFVVYVVWYQFKKVMGDLVKFYYLFIDVQIGEVYQCVFEFVYMFLKFGIGGCWFDKYYKDVFDGYDYVVVNGYKC